MFICTECKMQYETKPNYCNCGNNLFEENGNTAISEPKDIKETLSILIFAICIIFAVLVWFIG